MIKFSLIIPVYNVEKYLGDCIKSVFAQKYSNLEIILVDDGSTDSSGKLCDNYAKNDGRIVVIHKENGGLSSARNAALDVATGDYIAFLDSDDFIEEDFFTKVNDALSRTNADVCMFAHNLYNGENKTARFLSLENNFYKDNEIKEIIIPRFLGRTCDDDRALFGFVCMQVFSKKVVGQQRFKSEREFYAEDIVFDLELYLHVNSLCVINQPLYNYRYVESSLSNRYRKNLFDKFNSLLTFIDNYIKENNFNNCYNRLTYRAYRCALGGCLNEKKAKEKTFQEKKNFIKHIRNNSYVCESLKTYKPKGLKDKVFFLLLKMRFYRLILKLC